MKHVWRGVGVSSLSVAPRAGARIETRLAGGGSEQPQRRPPCGGAGLKRLSIVAGSSGCGRPPCGGAD